ncbi:MAG TPA: uracil-DNA glycosylase family protein [Cyclobacteriaceae bacterium]|nr:uracil-DNA glycosylase family protein [Cyclobacteriaceae bacterium]
MTLASKIIDFNRRLTIDKRIPKDIDVLNPYQSPGTFALVENFYSKYYNDDVARTLILGINPGRYGGGITGIPFTDPIKLEKICGIKNSLPKKAELSADFIYHVINDYGGPEKFYHHFYISSVSPLGFTKNGKNLNYYDIKELKECLKTFIVDSLQRQLAFGLNTKVCYCLGEGENFKFLRDLNTSWRFFETIVPLAHPRFIMQYRRKKVDDYTAAFLKKLNGIELNKS